MAAKTLMASMFLDSWWEHSLAGFTSVCMEDVGQKGRGGVND